MTENVLEKRLQKIENQLDNLDRLMTWIMETLKQDRKDISNTRIDMATTAEGQRQIMNEIDSQTTTIVKEVVETAAKEIPAKVEKGILKGLKKSNFRLPKQKYSWWNPFRFA